MASYELPLPRHGASRPPRARTVAALPEPLLVRNMLWFCRLRWLVVAFFTGLGLLGLAGVDLGIGLRLRGDWPLITAGVLVLYNIAVLLHIRRHQTVRGANGAVLNLWVQIVLDLLVLTVVIHFIGPTTTHVAFAYLFHIVLACIFFSRAQSLAVTLLACLLHTASVGAEALELIRPAGIFAPGAAAAPAVPSLPLAEMNAALAVLIWLGTWFLASRLSAMVRDRDDELNETNQRLVAAQQERAQHMLRTTHELKAPFAAIHSNTQLLLKGYCGKLPAKATEVASRILTRCRRLGDEIQEMLQLANLTSTGQRAPEPISLDLTEALAWAIDQIRPTADVRNIGIEADLQPFRTVAVEDHVKMLFINLVANAVNYSNDGGRVRVRCRDHGRDGATVTVEDDGIGIPPQKLPHIFDEYYRTNEAARHNRESTGLGLAIVRRVADRSKLRIRVQSSPGVGTKFEVRFPLPVSVQAPDRAGTKGG